MVVHTYLSYNFFPLSAPRGGNIYLGWPNYGVDARFRWLYCMYDVMLFPWEMIESFLATQFAEGKRMTHSGMLRIVKLRDIRT
jgi:hypothetical protein